MWTDFYADLCGFGRGYCVATYWGSFASCTDLRYRNCARNRPGPADILPRRRQLPLPYPPLTPPSPAPLPFPPLDHLHPPKSLFLPDIDYIVVNISDID